MKYIIILGLAYYIFRRYVMLPLSSATKSALNKHEPIKTKDDGEFVDYEEVDK